MKRGKEMNEGKEGRGNSNNIDMLLYSIYTVLAMDR